MKVLVLGGAGFLGRHVVRALAARGHAIVVGSRHPRRSARDRRLAGVDIEWRRVRLEQMVEPAAWLETVDGVDAVVNCVGILRERRRETYDRVHHLAPRALALACAARAIRLLHVSALGLSDDARSGFIRSKLDGERALRASGVRCTIVRPSLLDGEGGFGARWLHAIARWPVHFVPADACGRIAVIDVGQAARAIAALCEDERGTGLREVELGGSTALTMQAHLASLRASYGYPPARVVRVPAWLARIASHLCDALHFSPFSFGHLELLRRDNVPHANALPPIARSTAIPATRVHSASVSPTDHFTSCPTPKSGPFRPSSNLMREKSASI
jgi:uncharacterized protein YbjT (DUF2867 family)